MNTILTHLKSAFRAIVYVSVCFFAGAGVVAFLAHDSRGTRLGHIENVQEVGDKTELLITFKNAAVVMTNDTRDTFQLPYEKVYYIRNGVLYYDKTNRYLVKEYFAERAK